MKDRRALFPAPILPKTASIVTNVRLRKTAIIMGSSLLLTFSFVCVFGYLIGARNGFTVQIDRQSKIKNDLVLRQGSSLSEQSQEGVTYFNSRGLENAKPTTARKVFDYIDTLNIEEYADGVAVYSESQSIQRALVYIFTMENISDQDHEFVFSIDVNDYVPPTNSDANSPYSYLRILTGYQTEHEKTRIRRIYGAPNDSGVGTNENINDLRECISEYYESTDPYGFPSRTPTYFRNSTGFCENFTDDYPTIIRESHTIKAQEKKVFLVSFYFEGNDPDCTKSSPEGSALTFSAHFGG